MMSALTHLTGVPVSPLRTSEENTRAAYNKTSLYYIEALKELRQLESNPSYDRSRATALKERLDSLYAYLKGISEENTLLALEFFCLEKPPEMEPSQAAFIEDSKIPRLEGLEEYAIFCRFEDVKRCYIMEAKEVKFLEKIPPEQFRDRDVIHRLNEYLEHKYRWMQEYAAKNRMLVFELPPRLHSSQVQGGIKI